MLQGVADLAQTGTEIRQQRDHVDNVADELRERILRATTECPHAGVQPVTESILGGGYFDRLWELGRQNLAKAQNVVSTYDALLGAMGSAFDERRTRESDAVEKSALPVGITVGLLGLVAVAQTTFKADWDITPGWQWIVRVACWALAVATIVALVFILSSVRRVARLGSRAFERRYRKLSAYLSESSTVRLNEFSAALDGEEPDDEDPDRLESPAAEWHDLDVRLSARFARLWDEIFHVEKGGTGSSRSPAGIKELRRRTEEFCLRALLISERPRDFSRYPLPILTALYCACSSPLFVTQGNTPVGLVSGVEYRAVLGIAGVPDEDVDRITRHGRAWARKSAAHARKRIRDLIDIDEPVGIDPDEPVSPDAVPAGGTS